MMNKSILPILSLLVVCSGTLLVGCGDKPNVEGGTVVSAETLVADSIADISDPKIDESTLIVDTTVVNQNPEELAIPPRRFNSRSEALSFMQNSEHWNQYSSGILLQMLDDNFPYADRLLNNSYDYFIVADKQAMQVGLFDKYGNLVKSYPMACARNYGTKHKRSDCRTPEGFFFAQGVYDSTDWLYTDDNGYTSPTRGVYGPRFIRVKADVTSSIGIHGTGSPRSLGKRVSHGCMRLSNESILDLVKYVKAGTPIIVNPSDRDVAVNRSEGYNIVQIRTGMAPANVGKDLSGEVAEGYPAKPQIADSAKIASDTLRRLMLEHPEDSESTDKEPGTELPENNHTNSIPDSVPSH